MKKKYLILFCLFLFGISYSQSQFPILNLNNRQIVTNPYFQHRTIHSSVNRTASTATVHLTNSILAENIISYNNYIQGNDYNVFADPIFMDSIVKYKSNNVFYNVEVHKAISTFDPTSIYLNGQLTPFLNSSTPYTIDSLWLGTLYKKVPSGYSVTDTLIVEMAWGLPSNTSVFQALSVPTQSLVFRSPKINSSVLHGNVSFFTAPATNYRKIKVPLTSADTIGSVKYNANNGYVIIPGLNQAIPAGNIVSVGYTYKPGSTVTAGNVIYNFDNGAAQTKNGIIGLYYYDLTNNNHFYDSSSFSSSSFSGTRQRYGLFSGGNSVFNTCGYPSAQWSYMIGFSVSASVLNFSLTASSNTICAGNSVSISASGASTYTWSTGAITSSISVTPSVTTVYTVTGQTGTIINTQTISITVKPKPLIVVSSSVICAGQSYTIIPSGANSYSYSSGSAVVSPTVSTAYTIVGTATNGCSSNAISNVTVNPSPIISVSNGTICLGQSYTIIPSGANSYTYSSGLAIVSPTVNSTYTITGSSLNGCITNTISSVFVNSNPTVTASSGEICLGQSYTIVPSGANSYTYSSGLAAVSPTVNSTYTITGADLNGCLSNAVINVTVNPIPTITVNSGTICSGGNFIINPNGASTYSYSSGSATVNPTSTNVYTVIGTSSQNCLSSAQTLTVTVEMTPNVILQPINQLLVIGTNAQFIIAASINSNYQWQTNLGVGFQNLSNVGQYSGVNTATLTVNNISTSNNNQAFRCILSANTCTDVTNTSLITISSVGIDELSLLSNISIYPNPSIKEITINTSEKYTRVEIINSIGQSLFYETSNTVVSVSSLSSGLYTIRLYDEHKNLVKIAKFIKE